MSLQPPGLQRQGHVHGLTGQREAAPCRTAGKGQRPAPAETVPLVPWQRGGRRGSATTCLHLSTASLPAPSSWSKGLRCSAALFRPPPSHKNPTHPRDSPHTHANTPQQLAVEADKPVRSRTVMSETRLVSPTEHRQGFGQRHVSSAPSTARAGKWP